MNAEKIARRKYLKAYLFIICWFSFALKSDANSATQDVRLGACLDHMYSLRALFQSTQGNYYFITDHETKRSEWISSKTSSLGIQPIRYISSDKILHIKYNGSTCYLTLARTGVARARTHGTFEHKAIKALPNKPVQSESAKLKGAPSASFSSSTTSQVNPTSTASLSTSNLSGTIASSPHRRQAYRDSDTTQNSMAKHTQETASEISTPQQAEQVQTQIRNQNRALRIVKQPRPLNHIEFDLPEQ